MRRDIAAFCVSAGRFRKLETRKVTRKVANFASEILLRPATKSMKCFRFGLECSTEKTCHKRTQKRAQSAGGCCGAAARVCGRDARATAGKDASGPLGFRWRAVSLLSAADPTYPPFVRHFAAFCAHTTPTCQ